MIASQSIFSQSFKLFFGLILLTLLGACNFPKEMQGQYKDNFIGHTVSIEGASIELMGPMRLRANGIVSDEHSFASERWSGNSVVYYDQEETMN